MELGNTLDAKSPRQKLPTATIPSLSPLRVSFKERKTQGIRVIDWVRHVRDQQRDPRQLRDQHCLPAGNWQIQIGSYQIRSTTLFSRSASQPTIQGLALFASHDHHFFILFFIFLTTFMSSCCYGVSLGWEPFLIISRDTLLFALRLSGGRFGK
jgi:hypothetical protein